MTCKVICVVNEQSQHTNLGLTQMLTLSTIPGDLDRKPSPSLTLLSHKIMLQNGPRRNVENNNGSPCERELHAYPSEPALSIPLSIPLSILLLYLQPQYFFCSEPPLSPAGSDIEESINGGLMYQPSKDVGNPSFYHHSIFRLKASLMFYEEQD